MSEMESHLSPDLCAFMSLPQRKIRFMKLVLLLELFHILKLQSPSIILSVVRISRILISHCHKCKNLRRTKHATALVRWTDYTHPNHVKK